jgi:glycosyltransferase involved in cell wall biosynthesis
VSVQILFLDTSPSNHHKRFCELLSTLGTVHSVFIDFHQRIPKLQFDLVVFADIDVTFDYTLGFSAPKVAISWAWDLQQTVRSGDKVTKNLQRALASVDILIVDSKTTVRIAKDFGLPDSKIINVPYGIKLDEFPMRQEKPFDRQDVRIYTNRRWEELYRPEILLEMANELSQKGHKIELRLANNGSIRLALIEKYRELFEDGTCIYLGEVSQSRNVLELQEADLYISVSKSDGSSLSLLECMAIGTPVLVTDNMENRHWITDEISGYLFSGISGKELAEKVIDILFHSEFKLESPALNRERVFLEANWDVNSRNIHSRILGVIG